MVDTHRIYEWMARPEALNADTLHELRALLDRYPFFQTVRLLYLRNLIAVHDPDLLPELRRAAVHVADRKQLFRLVEAEKLRLLHAADVARPEAAAKLETVAQPESAEPSGEETSDRTLSLIDTFLKEMGVAPDESRSVTEVPAESVVSLVRDLPDAVSVEPMNGQALIDEFLHHEEETPAAAEVKDFAETALVASQDSDDEEDDTETDETEEKVEEENEEGYFTETLAKIYIKQQRYLKALEIIKKLYLKYPKKNVYFADQIRFLEKLIINNKSK